jgi:sugar O-acyltransferase (sialic acid O-acetyltransferase NeuD family)
VRCGGNEPLSARELQPLLIFPYNGNAIEAIDALDNRYQLVGFVDDTPEKQGPGEWGLPVFGRDALTQFAEAQVLAVPGAPGSYRERRRIISSLGIADDRFATVIHPTSRVSPRAVIGRNVLIMAGVVVSGTASIGNHVCVLPNTVVHHHAIVEDWTLVGSNVTIAGHVRIRANCYIGSGSCVIDHSEVGSCALVGLGSNVIASVPPGAKVVGNPARQIS